jgi:predicted kinase
MHLCASSAMLRIRIMPNILYIIRGLPGAGKNTLAEKLVHKDAVCSAHDYFYKEVDGKEVYVWDASKIRESHAYCMRNVELLMKGGKDCAVANTFTEWWEFSPYYDLADKYGYVVQQIIVKGPWKSVHNVPDAVLMRMQKRFQL